jgi:hypothetical protein
MKALFGQTKGPMFNWSENIIRTSDLMSAAMAQFFPSLLQLSLVLFKLQAYGI